MRRAAMDKVDSMQKQMGKHCRQRDGNPKNQKGMLEIKIRNEGCLQ